MKDTIKVLVVAEDETLCQRLCAVLDQARRISVVGLASDAPEAMRIGHKTRCDVILLDIDMPETTRRRILAQSRQESAARIIVLGQDGQEQQVLDALKNGAMGHVHKKEVQAEIVCAISAVNRGEAVITSAMAGCILDKVKQGR
jgi:DNA-binding NarL/FixJ family response regulator